jgi:hypothetical protein
MRGKCFIPKTFHSNSEIQKYSEVSGIIRFFRLFIRFASNTTGDKTSEPPSQLDTEKQQSQGWISRILTGPQFNPEGVHKQSHSSMLSVSDAIYELQSLFILLELGF